MFSDFRPTKKRVKELVISFMEDRSSIFSSIKRTMESVEDKVIDAVYEAVVDSAPRNEEEVRAVVDEVMRETVELADKYGFTEIIYDFVLEQRRD